MAGGTWRETCRPAARALVLIHTGSDEGYVKEARTFFLSLSTDQEAIMLRTNSWSYINRTNSWPYINNIYQKDAQFFKYFLTFGI